MPARWLLVKNIEVDPQTILSRNDLNKQAFDKVWEDPQATGPGAMKVTIHKETPQYQGALLNFGRRTAPKKEDNHSVLATSIYSDRADSCFLTISLPSDCDIYLNGKNVGASTNKRTDKHDLRFVYPWQPKNFDVEAFPVSLQKGDNAIVVVFKSRKYSHVWTYHFRLSFLTQTGEPLRFDDLTIQWQE